VFVDGPALGDGLGVVPPAPATVVPEGQVIHLAYRTGVVLRGKATCLDGTPVEGVKVYAKVARTDVSSPTVATNAMGEFQFLVVRGVTIERIIGFGRAGSGNPLTGELMNVESASGDVIMVMKEH
jgi:hypothetical protein